MACFIFCEIRKRRKIHFLREFGLKVLTSCQKYVSTFCWPARSAFLRGTKSTVLHGSVECANPWPWHNNFKTQTKKITKIKVPDNITIEVKSEN